MKKIILYYILALPFCLSSQAQLQFFGLIRDAEGYVNVRDGAVGYYVVWTVEDYLVKSLFALYEF